MQMCAAIQVPVLKSASVHAIVLSFGLLETQLEGHIKLARIHNI